MALILFDLDETLLGNEMGNFIPAYLQAFGKRLADFAEPAILIKRLLIATRRMIEDLNPEQTLEEKFDASFFPALNITRPDVQGIIDTFYRDDFPKLHELTQLRPAAVSLVMKLIERGDQVAIATNPLFPRTAILQRLSWAGLDANQIPFALIPSYETFHFAKPNPEFFAEFLGLLGWPEVPIIMVGDDCESDIDAANQLGLPVFWIKNSKETLWTGQAPLPPHGEVTDLVTWMDESQPQVLKPDFKHGRALLAVLRSTLAVLNSICIHQKNNLEWRSVPEEWSIGEVLCHFRDVETEVYLKRIIKIINEDNPTIIGIDVDPWAGERQYRTQDSLKALFDFSMARHETLSLMEALSVEDWNRPAHHSISGPLTLIELVNSIARHDISHLQQISGIKESKLN